jgi:hypothetical protein
MNTGQINLEFVAATFIYLGALGALVTAGQGILPEFTSNSEMASLNLEARQVSTNLLTTPGRQDFTGKTNWEKNETTIGNTTSIGLATGFKNVDREKIEQLRTANPRSGRNYFNYSQFKRVANADNQYQFTFTWMPVIETPDSFTRGNGASNTPSINEPNTDYYRSAGNQVHYGTEALNGTRYYFLVTSHNGIYNTTYVTPPSDAWNFQGYSPLGTGETFGENADEFTIQRFQNRENRPGTLLVVSEELKTFGANVDSDSRVINLYRYAVMEGEPLRVKVLAW